MKADRYRLPEAPEAQFEPGSRGKVLRNKLGITSLRAIHQAEFDAYLRAQEQLYDMVSPRTRFDAEWVCRIHRMCFEGIYEWAGRHRNVNLQSPGGPTWPPPHLIPRLMSEYERKILSAYTPGRSGPVARIALDLSVVHGELILIHPFRDGNGRVARLLVSLVALQARCAPPVWHVRTRNRQRYLQAIAAVFARDYGPLAEFTEEMLSRAIRIAQTPRGS